MSAENGKVYICYTVLDTEAGREVAESFRKRRPMGVSTRFKMTGHAASVDGEKVEGANVMHIAERKTAIDAAIEKTRGTVTGLVVAHQYFAQDSNTA